MWCGWAAHLSSRAHPNARPSVIRCLVQTVLRRARAPTPAVTLLPEQDLRPPPPSSSAQTPPVSLQLHHGAFQMNPVGARAPTGTSSLPSDVLGLPGFFEATF